MKYLKSLKLYESSKEENEFNFGISEEDIKDIFLEIIDMGYEFTIHKYYLTSNGHSFDSKKGLSGYYPTMNIRLYKIKDETKGEPINWDGSIYYNEDIDLLDNIINSVSILKSSVSKSTKVLYAIRGIHDINIRIVNTYVELGYDTSIEFLDEKLEELISKNINNHSNDFTNLKNLYRFDFGSSTPFLRRTIHIEPKLDYTIRNIEDLNNPETAGDWLLNRLSIDNNQTDNKKQLNSVFYSFMKKYHEEIGDDIKLYSGIANDYGFKYGVYRSDIQSDNKLADIVGYFEPYTSVTINSKKGLFKSKKSYNINIYKLEVEVKYIK